MKNRKRNLTMLAVLMFVCAAVALNWSYNNRWGTPDSEMVSAEDEMMMSANAEFADNLVNTGGEYFAEARLTRQVSRDEALELLQTADCVVYIGNDTVTVAVPAPAEGLSEEAVARITDIICTETAYQASQLSIIEVKA